MKKSIVIILLLLSNCLFAQTKIDSLENLLQNNTKNVSLLNELAFAYWSVAPDQGLKYANKAYLIALKNDNKKDIAKSLQNLGICYWAKGQLHLALKNYQKSLKIYVEIKNLKGTASLQSNMGIIYKDLSDYENALKYYLKSLKITEENGFTNLYIKTIGNISSLYVLQKHYKKALEYMQEAINLSGKLGDTSILSAQLNTMGQIYEAQKDYIKAKSTYKESLLLNRKNGNNYGTTISLYNIGNIEYYLENYTSSIAYFKESLILSEKINDQIGVLLANKSIGSIHKKQHKYNLALSYYKKALDLAIELNLNEDRLEIYKDYSELYKLAGKLNKSLVYLEKFILLNDSIHSENSSKQIAEMQTKYDSEKKEKENELLRKNSEIQNLEISKQTNLRNSFIGISILVILLIIILLNRFTIKKKVNKVLILKNEVILNQRDELKEINLTKDKFFSIISHDLKSPFNTILGYADLLYSDYDKYDDIKKKNFISIISKSSQAAYDLLQNLLTWTRSQQGKIKLTKEKLNLKELINLSINPYVACAQKKVIKLENKVSDEIIIKIDKYTISTAIGNIFNNAVKFTQEGGKITINVISKANYYEIIIEDNGIGMRREQLQKLFRIDESFSTKGTNNEKGTGLGLILCKEFVEKNGGNIKVESEIGKGSKFIISLPKNGLKL